jgi:hypothetical protein
MAKEDNSQIDNEPAEDEDSGEEAEASPKD